MPRRIQGMIFAGSRIYYSVGADHPAYRWLGHWNPRNGGGTPVHSLLLQGVVTLALVIAFGLYKDGFDAMLQFTTPVFYLFFLLTVISLFVLRRRDPDVERPFRVPLYPVTPILFAAAWRSCLVEPGYAWDHRRWSALVDRAAAGGDRREFLDDNAARGGAETLRATAATCG